MRVNSLRRGDAVQQRTNSLKNVQTITEATHHYTEALNER